ncbi:hypothetical protein A8144_08450 [Mycobacterium leprae 3125609]|nr:hypothetical protein A8144_08450 [Mycobacterium leprae 3125609]
MDTELTSIRVAVDRFHRIGVYPVSPMMSLKCIRVKYGVTRVVSCPSCTVLDDVKAECTLSASLPSAHSPYSESRKLHNCDAGEPNQVGQ